MTKPIAIHCATLSPQIVSAKKIAKVHSKEASSMKMAARAGVTFGKALPFVLAPDLSPQAIHRASTSRKPAAPIMGEASIADPMGAKTHVVMKAMPDSTKVQPANLSTALVPACPPDA